MDIPPRKIFSVFSNETTVNNGNGIVVGATGRQLITLFQLLYFVVFTALTGYAHYVNFTNTYTRGVSMGIKCSICGLESDRADWIGKKDPHCEVHDTEKKPTAPPSSPNPPAKQHEGPKPHEVHKPSTKRSETL